MVFVSSLFSECVYSQPVPAKVDAYADLPPEVREQFAKHVAAMKLFHLEFSDLWFESGFVGGSQARSWSIDFEGGHFYYRKERVSSEKGNSITYVSEVSFDGDIVYTAQPGPRVHLTKFSVTDAADPYYTRKRWEFPYFDAAGFYVPERMSELKEFASIEPLVVHYLKESDSTKVENEGENVRITARVPDPESVAAHGIDLDRYQKFLEASRPGHPETVAKEIAIYKRLQSTTPRRIVSFLLDPKHGYGVVEREERTEGGQRIVRTQVKDWKYFEKGTIWLPGQCVVWFHTLPGELDKFSDEPTSTNTFILKLVDFEGGRNIQFALDQKSDYQKAGATIHDRTVVEARANPNHGVTYTVAADGKLLRTSAEKVRTRRFFWIMFLILLAIPPLFLFIRWLRKTKGQSYNCDT